MNRKFNKIVIQNNITLQLQITKIKNNFPMNNFKTVHERGTVNPVKKWVIEAYYDMNN